MASRIDTLTNEQIKKILLSASGIQDKILNKYRLNILQQYKASLKEIQSVIAKMYEKFGDVIPPNQIYQYNRLKTIELQIQEEIRIADRRFKQLTRNAIKDIFENAYYRSGFAFESALGVKMGFSILSDKKIEAAILNPMDRITWINRATEHGRKLNQNIREEITRGIIQGKSYPEVARQIKKKIDIASTRLVRVVQTETHRAHTMGSLEAFSRIEALAEDSGFKVKKLWLATLDGKTRDEHRELDGQIADEDGLFHVAGFSAEAPGLFGVAELDINCRCEILTEVEGYETKFRRDNENGKIIEWKNYQQWAEDKKVKI